ILAVVLQMPAQSTPCKGERLRCDDRRTGRAARCRPCLGLLARSEYRKLIRRELVSSGEVGGQGADESCGGRARLFHWLGLGHTDGDTWARAEGARPQEHVAV